MGLKKNVGIRCRGNVFTESLPSNDMGTDVHTDWWEEFMKYAIYMGSVTMIYQTA
jgi:hypothetical protein